MNLLKIVGITCFIWFAYQQWQSGSEVSYGGGIKVTQAPLQTALSDPMAEIQMDEYRIQPLAKFSLDAKILSREDYWIGRESDLSPTDLALGWQKMSDESVLEQIDIRQSGRWYRWSVKQFPIPRRDIETQSANMHIVPADALIKTQLSQLKKGQLIRASGYLVKIQAEDGWRWQSSLTRDDTGNGACEVFYVEALQLLH